MMYRVTTGLMQHRKKPSYMTTMICPESTCGQIWDASRTDGTCPRCGCSNIVPLDKWDKTNGGALHLGRTGHHD